MAISSDFEGTIWEALKEYFDPEDLSITCDYCNQQKVFCRFSSVTHWPPNIIISIQGITRRFNINYPPLDMLDMQQLTAGNILLKYSDEPRVNYYLKAIIVHFGYGNESGHYIAYTSTLKNNKWISYDDLSVKAVDTTDLLKIIRENSSYLFYIKGE